MWIPILFLWFSLTAYAQDIDLILFNAKVISMAKLNQSATAVAVKGDRIFAVGKDEEILKLATSSTRKIDLKRQTLIPGFSDAHLHLLEMGTRKQHLELNGVASETEAANIVKERVNTAAKSAWILGEGWNQNKWAKKEFPKQASLNAIAPDNPVFLERIDGHAAWVNAQALAIAGINKNTPDPDGGKILRDSAGNPTGVLIDRAAGLVGKFIPEQTKAELRIAIESTFLDLLGAGITSVHDARTDRLTLEILQDLASEQKLPIRVYTLLNNSDGQFIAEQEKLGPRVGLFQNHLTVRGIKVFMDGALGSRGAALLEPYRDDPKNQGLLLTQPDVLAKTAAAALQSGFQIATHAIGDRSNRVALDTYEKAFRENPTFVNPRFRIEHAQIIHPHDIPRFARLGVIASMQASHCTSDMPWVHARIGEKLASAGAYAWQSLLRTHAVIANGSDAPVEPANPIQGIYFAVTRQDLEGKPPGGWHAAQKMTRRQALESFTIGPAYAAFEENLKGTIEVGKLADFTVLSQDITSIVPAKILETKVVYTIVGGQILYESASEHCILKKCGPILLPKSQF